MAISPIQEIKVKAKKKGSNSTHMHVISFKTKNEKLNASKYLVKIILVGFGQSVEVNI